MAIKSYYQSFLELIGPIIEDGIKQGEFRNVDVRETALAFGAIFEGSILLYMYFSDKIDFEKQFRTNLNLLLGGLLLKT